LPAFAPPCGVLLDTPQSSLLAALHLTPRWLSGMSPNPLISKKNPELDGGFGASSHSACFINSDDFNTIHESEPF
jgi:hypothetical protein